jgi:hypothetical protein
VAKATQPETDASLDRAEGYAGELGDLVVGEPGEERQLDRGSLLRGKCDQRRSQTTRLCCRGDGPADVLVERSMSLEMLERGAWLPRQLPRAEGVDRRVADDGHQPRPRRPPSGLIRRGRSPDAEKGVVHDILGDDPIAHELAGHGEGQRTEVAIEQVERGDVAGRDSGQQRAVVELARGAVILIRFSAVRPR